MPRSMPPRLPRPTLSVPYAVKIVLDSYNTQADARLTTFALTYPRFVHAELMTHRMFSRNSASSRAIPNEKLRAIVKETPALPVWWGKNQSGMQARQELSDEPDNENGGTAYDPIDGEPYRWAGPTVPSSPRSRVKEKWLEARDAMLKYSAELAEMGLHKQLCNRLIEPWMPITVLVSATDWGNWFHLRDHRDAQPEIQVVATEMHYQYLESKPALVGVRDWHMPYVREEDKDDVVSYLHRTVGVPEQEDGSAFMADMTEVLRKVSVGRCARVSYLTHEGKRDIEKDIELHDRLAATASSEDPGHFSPFEHVAMACATADRIGNFIGWVQYRKHFKGEAGPRA